MSDTKVNLRKIVGLEDEINKLAKQPDRARVLGDKGIHWLNGYGENGEEPTEEEKEEAAEKDKGKTGSRDLDDNKDASESLKIGDDAGDLGGLKDCKTGQCINVRLHGNARPPDGWNSVCDPPKDPTYRENLYISAEMDKRERVGDSDNFVTTTLPLTDYRTPQELVNAITSFFRMDATQSYGSYGCGETPILDFSIRSAFRWWMEGVSMGPSDVCYPDKVTTKRPHAYYWISARQNGCSDGAAICKQPPPTAKWPKDQCSEVVAGAGGFKGACAAHDPNLPSQFGSAQNEITLCDKDGNEVKFTKTDEGYEVYQAKYRRTAVVDPNTFKVVRFK